MQDWSLQAAKAAQSVIAPMAADRLEMVRFTEEVPSALVVRARKGVVEMTELA